MKTVLPGSVSMIHFSCVTVLHNSTVDPHSGTLFGGLLLSHGTVSGYTGPERKQDSIKGARGESVNLNMAPLNPLRLHARTLTGPLFLYGFYLFLFYVSEYFACVHASMPQYSQCLRRPGEGVCLLQLELQG